MPCVNIGIASFGCDQEQTLKLTNALEQQINQAVRNNATAVIGQSALTIQRLDLQDATIICSGSAKVDQRIEGKFQFVANVTQTLATDIRNVLTNALDSTTKANQESMQTLLDRAGAQTSYTDLVNQLKIAINQNITQDLMTRIAQNLATEQHINMRGVTLISPNCIITQDILLDVFASSVVKQASDVALENKAIQTVIQYLENEQKQESTISGWIWLIVALAFLGIVGLLIYRSARR